MHLRCQWCAVVITARVAAHQPSESRRRFFFAWQVYHSKPTDVSSALAVMLKNVPDAPALLYDGAAKPHDMISLQQQLLQRVAAARRRAALEQQQHAVDLVRVGEQSTW